MYKLLLIFLGSGLGGVLRFALSGWVQRLSEGTFPIGTLLVNVVGCLLIGALSGLFSGRLLVREEVRTMLFIGLLGGFTTFSTFGIETFSMLNEGQRLFALLNGLLSVVGSVLAVWIGYRVSEAWFGA